VYNHRCINRLQPLKYTSDYFSTASFFYNYKLLILCEQLQTHSIKKYRKSINYSLASLTAGEISLRASCGSPDEERAPLMHMISDLNSEKLNVHLNNKLCD